MSLYLLAGNSITVCQTLRKDGAEWVKIKEKILGYDADELMGKQYK